MYRNRTVWLVVAILFLFIIIVLAFLVLGRLFTAAPKSSPVTPGPSAAAGSEPSATPAVSMYPVVVPGSTANVWPTTNHAETFTGTLPPTPLLKAVRTGTHADAGFDRIAFDFQQDRPPGYLIGYTDQAVHDSTGQPITLPSNNILQIDFNPATAHSSSGSLPASPPTSPVAVGYTELQSYVMSGDSSDHVVFDLGLADRGGFQIREFQTGGVWTIQLDIHIPGR